MKPNKDSKASYQSCRNRLERAGVSEELLNRLTPAAWQNLARLPVIYKALRGTGLSQSDAHSLLWSLAVEHHPAFVAVISQLPENEIIGFRDRFPQQKDGDHE